MPTCVVNSFTRDPSLIYPICEDCISYAFCDGGIFPPICEYGSYTLEPGSNNKTCILCDPNLYSCDGGDEIRICAPNSYTKTPLARDKECLPCIPNADCDGYVMDAILNHDYSGDFPPVCRNGSFTLQPGLNDKTCIFCDPVLYRCPGQDQLPQCERGAYTLDKQEDREKLCR